MAIYRARGAAVDEDHRRCAVGNVVAAADGVWIEIGGTLDRIRYVPYP